MPDDLTPADLGQLTNDLSDAMKRAYRDPGTRSLSDAIAHAAAQHLVAMMHRYGYVVMKRPAIGDSAPRRRP